VYVHCKTLLKSNGTYVVVRNIQSVVEAGAGQRV